VKRALKYSCWGRGTSIHPTATGLIPVPGEGSQVSRRAPQEPKGTPATPASKSAPSRAQLNCHQANTCSMGNKQEELETCTHLQGYDLIGVTETWVGWLL